MEVQISTGMQLGTIDLKQKIVESEAHLMYHLSRVPNCTMQTTVSTDGCLRIAPIAATLVKFRRWGFSFVVTGTYLSCCPASAVFLLFSLSFNVSSTHLDTDRLGNSSS